MHRGIQGVCRLKTPPGSGRFGCCSLRKPVRSSILPCRSGLMPGEKFRSRSLEAGRSPNWWKRRPRLRRFLGRRKPRPNGSDGSLRGRLVLTMRTDSTTVIVHSTAASRRMPSVIWSGSGSE